MRRAILLGLVQGPAEMAPVSSSAHIATLQLFWQRHRADSPSAAGADAAAGPRARSSSPESRLAARRKSLEVALHGGGALPLALVLVPRLRRDWSRTAGGTAAARRRRIALLALSLAPPSLAGYRWEGPIERRLGGPRATAAGLTIGAVAMALADSRPQRRTLEQARPRDGLALGFAQAAALMPGVSRRGATLAAARAVGFGRRDADALSWLAGLPVIFAAVTLKSVRLAGAEREERAELLAGAGASFASTLVAARASERARLGERSLAPFCAYRAALALAILRSARHIS